MPRINLFTVFKVSAAWRGLQFCRP